MNFNNFCAVDLPFPSADEQRKTAVALREATANTATTITRAQHQIDLMSEYRTRLIADMVTGQLDVREAAEHLPNDLPEGQLPPTTEEQTNCTGHGTPRRTE